MRSSLLEGSANSSDAYVAIIGPTQVGGLLSAALFGCLACQSYLYFTRFASDSLALKATVSAIILIQLGQFVCIISTLQTMTVSAYSDPSQLSILPLAADLVIMLSGFTVFIAHSFYAFRLWKLTRSIFLPILCGMLSVVAQISMIILSVRAISMTDIMTFIDSQIVLIALSWIARAVCDYITTVGVTWSLRKGRVSGFRDTSTMVDRLIHWTLESALVNGLTTVTVMILFMVMPQNFVGNSLLASLNWRLLLRENRKSSRGDAQSRGVGLTFKFKCSKKKSSINQEQNRVSKPAVVHIQQIMKRVYDEMVYQ
ncbi:uncharacterized protein F5147DRAFT_658296 [Suillus discolor]|uniref:DUF6534 domain-containing protein n=1 Tax=Suillus discolor TaxID=1912936 RepID=A0A9P7JMI1_9AGAM|nr:uncharacterized protein F5147DRAFT_658296 [Suillus discolor]KAG2089840.1 hypothetical protein F5147DRAFT_658296 [Suillus discolor]